MAKNANPPPSNEPNTALLKLPLGELLHFHELVSDMVATGGALQDYLERKILERNPGHTFATSTDDSTSSPPKSGEEKPGKSPDEPSQKSKVMS